MLLNVVDLKCLKVGGSFYKTCHYLEYFLAWERCNYFNMLEPGKSFKTFNKGLELDQLFYNFFNKLIITDQIFSIVIFVVSLISSVLFIDDSIDRVAHIY